MIKLMTCDDIELDLVAIRALVNDPEKAHAMEDALFRAVLISISRGAPKPVSLARRAIKSLSIHFPRWTS